MSLSDEETERYARHIALKGFGAEGQRTLKDAKILIVGAGGLGSPVLAYLAAAGVGALTIADADLVALSNLQRQIVHRTYGIGINKADSAKGFAKALNPDIAVTAIASDLDATNAAALMADQDVVIDGTDRFATRKMIAEAAEAVRVPLVAGAVSQFDGQVTVFAPHLGGPDGTPLPRFADLYPTTPDEASLPPCELVGVLGALTGVIGTLMAMEAIKLLTGIGPPLFGRLLLYDGRAAKFSEFSYRRRG